MQEGNSENPQDKSQVLVADVVMPLISNIPQGDMLKAFSTGSSYKPEGVVQAILTTTSPNLSTSTALTSGTAVDQRSRSHSRSNAEIDSKGVGLEPPPQPVAVRSCHDRQPPLDGSRNGLAGFKRF